MICPRCGSFMDAGEPYCPDCGYEGEDETVSVSCDEYDRDELEEALREFGYDLDDLDAGLIDEDLLKGLLEDLESY